MKRSFEQRFTYRKFHCACPRSNGVAIHTVWISFVITVISVENGDRLQFIPLAKGTNYIISNYSTNARFLDMK